MNISVDRELLTRFVRGECTVSEQEQVKLLLNQTEWKQALEELLAADFGSFEYTPYSETENAAWNRQFRDSYASRYPSQHSRRNTGWIGYAAACFLAVSICFWYFKDSSANKQRTVMLEQINPKGQRSVVTLPDSTIVYLGAASSIRYPEHFGLNSREVLLRGEAYFEVTRNTHHPFIVTTGRIQTKVLGTSFKISAFKDIIVSVTTGKVQVANRDSTKAFITPIAVLTRGQQATWNPGTGKTVYSNVSAGEVAEWKEGKITFANAALADIAQTLERWYDVEIQFKNEELARTRLSMIVRSTVPVQHSMDIICSTLHLRYTLNKRTIVINP